MKRSIKGLLTLLIVASVSSQGIGINYAGAKSYSMGGAYRAVANDYSAFFWNPAGLTQLSGAQMGMSTLLVEARASVTPYETDNGSNYAGVYSKEEVNVKPKTFVIPTFGYFRQAGNLTYGLGVNVPFGLGATFDMLYDRPFGYNEANQPYLGKLDRYEYESDLQVINIQPTFAYKVTEELSVGFGASFYLSEMKIKSPSIIDIHTVNASLAPLFSNGLRRTVVDQVLEGSGNGFGVNLGLHYKVSEKFNVGINYRKSLPIELEGDLNARALAPNAPEAATRAVGAIEAKIAAATNDIEKAQLEGAKNLVAALYGLAPSALTEGYASVINEKVTAELNLPEDLGIGFAYQATNRLLLSADVNWTRWSVLDRIDIDVANTTSDKELLLNWKDVVRYSAGFEYVAAKNLVLNGGFYVTETPTNDETFDPSIPDVNDRQEYVLGGVYNLSEKIGVRLTYGHIVFADRDIKSWKYSEDFKAAGIAGGAGTNENVAALYKGDVSELAIELNYNF